MHDPSYLSNDAKHRFLLQSMVELADKFQFDVVARYVDYLPATFATVRVPEYFTFDGRIAFVSENWEFAVIGQNLWSKRHTEFGALEIPRGVYGKIACRL
jgi:iron complex outermembrane recepter protein